MIESWWPQSCAQIDNNQQVYEAQIQVPRCNMSVKSSGHFILIDVWRAHSPKAHVNAMVNPALYNVYLNDYCVDFGV